MIPLEEGTYRITVSGINGDNGDYFENVYYFQQIGPILGHDDFEIALELAEQFVALPLVSMVDVLAGNIIIQAVACKRADAVGGPTAVVLVTEVGTKTNCETIGNGAQVTWLGDTSPILLGRTYFPGIPNDSLDGSVWDAAYTTSMGIHILAMTTAIPVFAAVAAFHFVITSRQIGVASQFAKHGLLRAVPGTQRRRLRR